jgi:hypothetical protein
MLNKFRLGITIIVLTLIISARILEYIYWDNNKKENFTPYLNGLVRPHFRNARMRAENLTKDTNGFFRKMIRKSGLYY